MRLYFYYNYIKQLKKIYFNKFKVINKIFNSIFKFLLNNLYLYIYIIIYKLNYLFKNLRIYKELNNNFFILKKFT